MTNHELAKTIGRSRVKLYHRLRQGICSLRGEYRKLFPLDREDLFDVEHRRIISTDGRFALQWFNTGELPVGSCHLVVIQPPS